MKFITHLLNIYICKDTNKKKLILQTTTLEVKPI